MSLSRGNQSPEYHVSMCLDLADLLVKRMGPWIAWHYLFLRMGSWEFHLHENVLRAKRKMIGSQK